LNGSAVRGHQGPSGVRCGVWRGAHDDEGINDFPLPLPRTLGDTGLPFRLSIEVDMVARQQILMRALTMLAGAALAGGCGHPLSQPEDLSTSDLAVVTDLSVGRSDMPIDMALPGDAQI